MDLDAGEVATQSPAQGGFAKEHGGSASVHKQPMRPSHTERKARLRLALAAALQCNDELSAILAATGLSQVGRAADVDLVARLQAMVPVFKDKKGCFQKGHTSTLIT